LKTFNLDRNPTVGKKSPYKTGGMFQGASAIVFQYAKERRKIMTSAEMLLWGAFEKRNEGIQIQTSTSNWNLYCGSVLPQIKTGN
jgi:hypothetical protein